MNRCECVGKCVGGRGLYAYQLEHWLRFFPPEQLLVLNHEQVWMCGKVCGWGGSRAIASR